MILRKNNPYDKRVALENVVLRNGRGHPITYSNVGDNEMFQDDFYFVVSFDKWRFCDSRWDSIPSYDLNNPWNSYKYENISLEFEKLSLQSGENVGIIYVSQLLIQMF